MRRFLYLLPVCFLLLAWPGRGRPQGNLTYFYVARSVDANGRVSATASNEITVTVAPNQSKVTLTWTAAVAGSDPATGYNLYRGTAAGAEATVPINITVINGLQYIDLIANPNPPTGLAGVSGS